MRLPPHAAHQPIGIKCQVANRIDSLFLRLEIVRDRRSMRSGQRCVANQIEIWFGAAGDNGQADRVAIAAFCLDIAQDGFALKAIETFADGQCHTVFRKIIREPRAGIRVEIAV